MVGSCGHAEAQDRFTRLLWLHDRWLIGGRPLTAAQREQLLSRVSWKELSDIDAADRQCVKQVKVFYAPLATAFHLGNIHMIRDIWLPYRLGPMGYVVGGSLLLVLNGVLGVHVLRKERVNPKIALLCKKYGSAESTANYETLAKSSRGVFTRHCIRGRSACVVPVDHQVNPFPVATVVPVPVDTVVPFPVTTVDPMPLATVMQETKPELRLEQIEYLMKRLPPAEREEIGNIFVRCCDEVIFSRHVFTASLPIGFATILTKFKFGPKTWQFYVICCLATMAYICLLIRGIIVMYVERRNEMLAPLWKKYGCDESWTNYEALRNGKRGGASRDRLEKSGN